MYLPHCLILSLTLLLVAGTRGDLVTDPLLSDDTRRGTVHAVEVCIDQRAVEMFEKLCPFVVSDATKEESRRACDYYLIQFFNQYISDIDIDICEAVQRAVRTARFRIADKSFTVRSFMKKRIDEICHAHTFHISPTDYYSSLDRIPLCLRRRIGQVMDNVYGHH